MRAAEAMAELRRADRHSCALELRFSYQQGGMQYVGSGRTKDMNEEAICFETDQVLNNKTELEIQIDWPYRLKDLCDLELVVRGRVVRQTAAQTVLRMERYEFRTHGERSFHESDRRGMTCNIAA